MIKLTRKFLPSAEKYSTASVTNYTTLSLPIDIRIRSRSHVQLDDGREAGIFLERGSSLQDGDLLATDDGLVIKIVAAYETVSTVHSSNSLGLMKAAYHLGNRHVPLQVEKYWLRYQHDPVLDNMLILMGLEVKVEQAAFEPEAGAYQNHANHSHQN